MSTPVLPPGAERVLRLRDLIVDVDEAVAGLCDALPQINDRDLRPRILAFVEGARTTLDAQEDYPGPEAADRLNALLNGVRELRIPARDPELGGTPTLKALEQSTGVIAIRLINALEAAAAMGWMPKEPELPDRLTAIVSRDEAGTLLDRIADRLDAVKSSLDQLVAASNNAPRHQQGLVNFYVGAVHVELNLARMELKVGETRVDFASLWRAAEAIAGFTADFLATLRAWAARVAGPLMQAAGTVHRRVSRMVSGIGTTLRFAARKRRRAEAEAITAPPDPPVPDDVEKQARAMILDGRAPPVAWRPFIRGLDFTGTSLDSLAPLAGLSGLRTLSLTGTPVADLAPLAGLSGLRTLSLNGTPVADLAPLAWLTGLQRLYLDEGQTVDVSPLARLKDLTIIRLPREAAAAPPEAEA